MVGIIGAQLKYLKHTPNPPKKRFDLISLFSKLQGLFIHRIFEILVSTQHYSGKIVLDIHNIFKDPLHKTKIFEKLKKKL